jgi:AcrR family transcriptional regulator
LAAGSTSNHFRTRDALLNAVVERFAARERAAWEDLARRMYPTTPHELAQVLVAIPLGRRLDVPPDARRAQRGPVSRDGIGLVLRGALAVRSPLDVDAAAGGELGESVVVALADGA